MTAEILLVLAILIIAIVLFVTEKLRVDVVALLVLGGLAVFGLVTAPEAISGFSNSAVVTVWAVFILSGGLGQTGIANLIGRQVLRLAGDGEVRLLIVIMITAGVMSAFMNNIGVAALLLPVILDIADGVWRAPGRDIDPYWYAAQHFNQRRPARCRFTAVWFFRLRPGRCRRAASGDGVYGVAWSPFAAGARPDSGYHRTWKWTH